MFYINLALCFSLAFLGYETLRSGLPLKCKLARIGFFVILATSSLVVAASIGSFVFPTMEILTEVHANIIINIGFILILASKINEKRN